MMHKISVVVPVYNVEKYVKECLDGILSSKEDIEVIAVNDGSTDNSLAVLNSFKDKRLKVFSKENEGLYKTWKYGAEKATGDYIVFVDSDDYIDGRLFARINEILEKRDYDFIQFGWYINYPSGKQEKVVMLAEIRSGEYDENNIGEIKTRIIETFNRGYFTLSRCGKVYRTEFLKELLNDSIEDISVFEDNSANIPLVSIAETAYIESGCYYYYRIGLSNSVSNLRRKSERYYKDCVNINKYLQRVKDKFNISQKALDAEYFKTFLWLSLRVIIGKDYRFLKVLERDEKFKSLLKNVDKTDALKRDVTISKLLLKKRYRTIRFLIRANEIMKKLRRKG